MIQKKRSYIFGLSLIGLLVFALCHACRAGQVRHPISGAISVLLSYVEPPEPKVLACFGDSITEGVDSSIMSYPERIQDANTNIVVYNCGLGGEQSCQAVSRISSVISTYKPDLMIIQFGFNDIFAQRRTPGEVLSSLSSLVQTCLSNEIIPIMCTLLPTTRSYIDQHDLYDLNVLIKSYAKTNNINYVDLNLIFWQLDWANWGMGLISSDGVHPNNWGTQVMADSFNQKVIEILATID